MLNSRALLGAVSRRLPVSVQVDLIRRVRRGRKRLRRVRRIDWGDLARGRPISECYGEDRGTPVDRVFIERFLERHRTDIRCRALEVGSPDYCVRFGDRIESVDVVDIDPTNPRSTILVDLGTPHALPEDTFDCIVFTQTLQFMRSPEMVLQNLWRSLRIGGVLLLTAPAVSRIDPATPDADRWRFTPQGLESMLTSALPGASAEVSALGGLWACTAFLYGISAEELPDAALTNDITFPLLSAARVVKSQRSRP